MNFILGEKLGMSQFFQEDGKVVPVTLVQAGPCYVTQIKKTDNDGYDAVQVAFGERKFKNIKKPQKGILNNLKKVNKNLAEKFEKKFPYYFVEFKPENIDDFKLGDEINLDNFKEGDKVFISATSKAKGFQGVVKRHGFSGFSATHGTKHGLRAPGSIGSAFPERVWPGKKMPGRMGGERVTMKGLKIVKVDKENNILALKGALPGKKGMLVEIKHQS